MQISLTIISDGEKNLDLFIKNKEGDIAYFQGGGPGYIWGKSHPAEQELMRGFFAMLEGVKQFIADPKAPVLTSRFGEIHEIGSCKVIRYVAGQLCGLQAANGNLAEGWYLLRNKVFYKLPERGEWVEVFAMQDE